MKKTAYLGVILLFLGFIVSCEKDFQDIGTYIISNGVFDTKDTLLDIEISTKELDSVQADGGITISINEFLFGVFKSLDNSPTESQYKTIEASLVSQLLVPSTLNTATTLADGETISEKRFDEVIFKNPITSYKNRYKNGSS